MSMTMQNKIERLLKGSISQHGFKLINNIEHIEQDLQFLLTWHGGNVSEALEHLDDCSSDFVVKLYLKIDKARRKGCDAL